MYFLYLLFVNGHQNYINKNNTKIYKHIMQFKCVLDLKKTVLRQVFVLKNNKYHCEV